MKERRVLHLRSSGGMLGAESVILELARHSRDHGYQAVVGVIRDSRRARPDVLRAAEAAGVDTCEFKAAWKYDIRTISQLRTFVESESIDLVHTHGYREDVLATLAFLPCPRIATNHLWKLISLRLHVYAALDSFILRTFPRVIAVSSEIASDMARRGIAGSSIRVIPNGIDSSKYSQRGPFAHRVEERRRLGAGDDDLIVTMVSSLSPEKGHIYAIEAFAQALAQDSRLFLVVAGSGSEEAALRHCAERLGITDRVGFIGWVRNVAPLLEATDVFLLPSLQEGLPIALLEAMAAGRAVIATEVGDIPRALAEESGLLVPPANSVMLANALMRLSSDASLRETLGNAARQRVQKHYSSERMTARYCEQYDQILGHRRRGLNA